VDSEQQLLERALLYDEDALGEIYDRYAPLIYRYLYRRVQSVQLAEDLTGDVFVRMLGALRAQRFQLGTFQAWLYRIAHNLVVDHYREKQPALLGDLTSTAEAENPDASSDEMLGEAMLSSQELEAAMRQLTPDQQQVLVLRFGQGFTARETAKVIEKSVGAIEALQRRALAALRRMLGEEVP